MIGKKNKTDSTNLDNLEFTQNPRGFGKDHKLSSIPNLELKSGPVMSNIFYDEATKIVPLPRKYSGLKGRKFVLAVMIILALVGLVIVAAIWSISNSILSGVVVALTTGLGKLIDGIVGHIKDNEK